MALTYLVREVEKCLSRNAQRVYEGFEQDNLLDQYPMYKQEEPVSRFVEEQVEPCAEDISKECHSEGIDINEDNVENIVQDYVDENYDTSFVYDQLSHKFDFDKAFEDARGELRLQLQNTEPFNNYSVDYFVRAANSINNLTELFGYATTDGVYEFVETYAPEYEEEASK